MSTFEKFIEQLQKEHLEDVVDILNAEEIDAENVGLITEDMLDKIGIRPLGRRLKVMKILLDVKQKLISIGDCSIPGNVLDLSQTVISLDVQCTSPGKPIMSITPKQEIISSSVKSASSVKIFKDNIQDANSLELLPSPLPYPSYSKVVTDAEANGNVLLVRAKLIKESARFYMSVSHDLSRHYNQISQHLIARFPALKDAIVLPGASVNYAKLKKDLAQSVRNHKRPGASTVRTSAAATVVIKDEVIRDMVSGDLLPMNLGELSKEHKKSKPSKDHIRRLLGMTIGNFKSWIEQDEPPTIVQVLEQYPVLQCPEWIIFQAGLILKVQDFYQQVEERLTLLFYSVTKIQDLDNLADYETLKFVESCINTKKCSSILIVTEVGCEPTQPASNTPTLMVVLASSVITQAFLFVDKILVNEVEKPTVINLLILWLSTHYCFNIQYGKATINIAHILEDCVLQEWGVNSIQNLSSCADAPKSRKIIRPNKIQTFYGRLQAQGFNI